MRIVFMGTPDFAVPSLRALLEAPAELGLEVVGVFTQPDRPKGRGNRLTPPPVKQLAEQHHIPVYQPEKIRRESPDTLRALRPDLCVTAAFGQILSQELLDIPPLGCLNVHASLLPKHRGSAPIAWALLQGDAEIGVTIMRMAAGIDTGDMLLQRAIPRPEGLSCGEATEQLAELGAQLLLETIRAMQQGTLTETPQDEEQATYEPKLTKAMGLMDWRRPARELVWQIHALNPWPACTALLGETRLKLLRAETAEGAGQPGEILQADAAKGLIIACGEGALCVRELQAPGSRAMNAKDYLRGHSLAGTFVSETAEEEETK